MNWFEIIWMCSVFFFLGLIIGTSKTFTEWLKK